MLGSMSEAAIATFRSIVGDEHVLVDAGVKAGFETDWTGRYTGPAIAVLRPGATDEVAAILRQCSAAGLAVVPQGGNTGLVGGGVPRPGPGRPPAIVLSTVRLSALGPVDAGAQQVTAGAGVTLARWRDHARRAGLDTPIDFAARDSATIGGAIATNAGGSRVLRFGTMRTQVAGIEAVLADGSIVGSLAGLPKETAGIHWPSILSGSEGTLAVITRARLRLVPFYRCTTTAMLATATVDDAVFLLARLRTEVASLDSAEVVFPAAIELVGRHIGSPPPVEVHGCVLLVECADHDDPSAELLDTLGRSPEVLDSAVATEPGPRGRLLQFRDRITEAVGAAAAASGETPFKLDVAVPVESVGRLLQTARAAAEADGALLIPFGHLAEGNLHLNHLGVQDPSRLAGTVLAAVAALGGTISAEHGIGVAKTRWMPLIRTPADLAAQRRLADALDPGHILNQGVLLLPAEGQVP